MSIEYNMYLEEHIQNVQRAYNWISTHLGYHTESHIIAEHDASKYSNEEYEAYDKYFYGGNRSSYVVNNFNEAWLHHIHNNPHHWQHWVLIQDDGPEIVMTMPLCYILEMICDWWSFSFKKGNLYEIFDWYGEHGAKMKLHPSTRKMVEKILGEIKSVLDGEKEAVNAK